MIDSPSAIPRYRADENAWLITLPEKQNGETHYRALTLMATRTITDEYTPPGIEDRGPRHLKRRECELKLYWRGGTVSFPARFNVSFYSSPPELDLTNGYFELQEELRGRGLGSWCMQQLVSWAKTLPPDTTVKPIKTSPGDEADPINHARRDHFWHGLGFRFASGSRTSLPLTVNELKLPVVSDAKLDVVLLHRGVLSLAEDNDSYKVQIEAKSRALKDRADEIARLTKLQPHMLLMQLICAPFKLLSWLVHQVKRPFAARHVQQKETHPDDHEG
ncbi:hypothetical protein [Cronobacter sakazakii]|uniref:Uncharacterized protein n=1 Tax=Cronobacter sakazakii TaxID=28141 RepID=A0AA44Z6C9_CROSK|nr:hypothetical protein [Cronobacter sakazakii]PUW01486.1 hypothetical protein B7T07_20570 [Cronobacter sakazakii]